MLSKKDIVMINKEFHTGHITNEGSLDFALEHARKTKDWIKAAAYLVRAILIDHAFEDGNKRTAAGVIIAYLDINGAPRNDYKIGKMILKMMKSNITDIRKIARMIENATE